MRSRREPILDERQLYDRALRLLTQKSRSVAHLRRLLKKHGVDSQRVQKVIDKCIAQGYLDDVKYAVQFARSQAEKRRHGRRRVTLELRSRGIAERIIRQAIEEVFGDVDETTLMARALDARLQRVRGPWDQKKMKKLYDQLVRAGFDTETILHELKARGMMKSPRLDFPEEE